MSDSNSSSSGGIGVLGLLGIVFVTLKLCGIINWPWIYVTLPFWGGFAILIVIAAIAFVGFGSAIAYDKVKNRKNNT